MAEELTDSRLMSGEQVIFKTTKHWMAPLADSWVAILLIIGSVVLAWLQTDQANGIMGFVNRLLSLGEIGLLLGGIGWIIYNVIAWRSAEYMVTNLRLFGDEGLLRKRQTDSLLSSVADVRLRITAVGKALDYGDVQILSASGQAGSDKFTTVRRPVEFHKAIIEQKVKATNAAAAPAAPAAQVAGAAPAGMTSAQAETMSAINSLAAMRDLGAITAEEFDAKKAELLARI